MISQVAPTGRTYEFGMKDRIRAAREQNGYDQETLATATGLSRQSISSYERGVSHPRRPALAAIALATGFDYAWLETGARGHGGKPAD